MSEHEEFKHLNCVNNILKQGINNNFTTSDNGAHEEYQYLKTSLTNIENSCFQYFTNNQNIKYESKTVSNVNMVPVTFEFDDIQRLEFAKGRFFNELESNGVGAWMAACGGGIRRKAPARRIGI